MENKCIHCGSNNIKETLTVNTIHHARLDCLNCNKFINWIKKPTNEGIRTRTSKWDINQILKFHKMTKEFCWFCLRNRENLGYSETLTIDHIQELDKDGKDEIENLQILCSACHKLKNWARLYINWHLNKFYKKDDKID